MSRFWTLLFDELFVVGCAVLAAKNYDNGNHFWFTVWGVLTILAIVGYAHNLTVTYPTKKDAA